MQQERIYPQIQSHADELMNSLFLEVETALAISPTPPPAAAIIKLTEPVPPPEELDLPVDIRSEAVEPSSEFVDNFLLGATLTSAIFAVAIAGINFYSSGLKNPQPTVASLPDSPVAEQLRRSLLEIKPTKAQDNVRDTTAIKPIYIPINQPPITPSPVVNQPVSQPVNQPVSQPVKPPLAQPTPPPAYQTPAASPKGNYTLIGVLDLGDRSKAMFDINGSVQSIQVGSPVADSGWQLTRVGNQEVVLQKGQQNATVAVGQKF